MNTRGPEKREVLENRGGKRPTTGKEKDKPIRPKNKEQKCARERERERVAEVEDRSRKDTKTEKNGDTPGERSGLNWREG